MPEAYDPNLPLPPFIVIEGPLGIGKTALAKKLASHFNHQPILEDNSNNPFLDIFYQQGNNALATQLSFLFQRIQLLQQLSNDDLLQSSYICNFLINKDQLFAKTILSQEEYLIYQQVFEMSDIPKVKPNLVVYLQAPSSTLQEHLNNRSNQVNNIPLDYLNRINQAYSEFFYYYDETPLLIINAEHVDLINDESAFKSLIETIVTVKNGRHYFNPSFFNEAIA